MNAGKPLRSMVAWAGLMILLSATSQAQVGPGGGLGSGEMTSSTPTIPYPGAGRMDWGFSTSITDYDHHGNPAFDCEVGISDHHDKKKFHDEISEAFDVDDQIRQLKQQLRTNRQQIAQLGGRRNAHIEKVLHPKQATRLNEERLAATRHAAQANLEFLSQYANFLRPFSAADELTFYQGLPRQDYPPDPFPKNAKEAKSLGKSEDWCDYNSILDWIEEKKTFSLNHPNDYWFYRSAVLVDTTAVQKIRSTLVDYRSFKPLDDGWMGGVFTPDFCIEWKAKPRVGKVLEPNFFLYVDVNMMQAQFFTPTSSCKFSFSEEVRDEFLRLIKKTDHWQADKRTDNGPN